MSPSLNKQQKGIVVQRRHIDFVFFQESLLLIEGQKDYFAGLAALDVLGLSTPLERGFDG